MKSTYLILAAICLGVWVQAQNEFAPLGTKWTYSISNSSLWFLEEPTSLEVVEVQTINGKSMKRLLSIGYKGCAAFSEWIYEENGKVYQYFNQKSYLLYDFNANKGDSWKIVFNTPLHGLDSVMVQVDSISKINTTFGMKKVQYLKRVAIKEYKGEFLGEIIEGIGSTNYFFPNFGLCDASPHQIRCFGQNGTTTQFVNYDCDKTINWLAAEDLANNIALNISPNPTNNYITIDSRELPNTSCVWVLFDTQGKQVFSYVLANEKNTIDLPTSLPQGIYFWRVFNGIQQLGQGKLVIVM